MHGLWGCYDAAQRGSGRLLRFLRTRWVETFRTSSRATVVADLPTFLRVPALALARVLPNGDRAIRTEPICLDIAVINARGQDHCRHTATRSGSAADSYSVAKAARNDISNKCWAAGYRFWPVVHEIQGGMAKGADAAMKRESMDAATLRVEFMGRLAAVITRTATRAVQKRQAKQRNGTTSDLPAMIVRQVLTAVEQELNEDEELGIEGL